MSGPSNRMVPDWIESSGLEQLTGHKEEILASGVGGTTVDLETILEELGIEGDDFDEDDVLSRWFDECVERLARHFADGSGIVHRAIGIDDAAAFAIGFWRGDDVGSHWTTEPGCASTRYHGGAATFHDVVATGRVAVEDISWGTTIQKLFGHPHEREVNVHGSVVPMALVMADTGEAVPVPLPAAA